VVGVAVAVSSDSVSCLNETLFWLSAQRFVFEYVCSSQISISYSTIICKTVFRHLSCVTSCSNLKFVNCYISIGCMSRT